MITLLVDEAYAFDYLSILELKKELNANCYKNWENCKKYIRDNIGIDLMDNIIKSAEYENLRKANQITFDAVEKARYGSITAKEVDDANMMRHKRKLELQNKFFNNILTETKT